jgi:hypothetical protein
MNKLRVINMGGGFESHPRLQIFAFVLVVVSFETVINEGSIPRLQRSTSAPMTYER